MTAALRPLDRAGAFRLGLIDAGQVPAIALITSMMSFGSLVRESGMEFSFAIVSSAVMWALPGQIALVELHATGATLFAVVLAVAMANARFFPMTATMGPLFRDGVRRKGWLYPLSHFITFNSWLWVVRRFPELGQVARVWYFIGFGTVCYTSGLAGTAIGYYVSDSLPSGVTLGLVYLVVIYFIVMLSDIRKPPALAAVACGAVAGPLFHLLDSDWGLLLEGVVGCTVAFVFSRQVLGVGRREGGSHG